MTQPTAAELEAIDAHKDDLDEMTHYRWRRKLPIQFERLKRLPKLARIIADEAEALAAQPAEAN